MRTSYTVQSSYAGEKLREVMWQYAQYGYRCDEDTVAAIAEETKIAPKNVENLDGDGKPKHRAGRKVPFIELAAAHSLASPDAADRHIAEHWKRCVRHSANSI